MAPLEQPKKPVGGAFGCFLAEKREEFTKACAGQPVKAVSVMAGLEWKKLADPQRVLYQSRYEAKKEKFDVDIKAFLDAGGEMKTKKSKRAGGKRKVEKDPNRPKRPAGGAFGCFLARNRAAFQKECPGSVAGVSKLAGAKWKALPQAEKDAYEKEYQGKRAAYELAMKSYVPPVGAEAEEDGDEDEEDDDLEEEEEEEAEPTAKKGRLAPVFKKPAAAE